MSENMKAIKEMHVKNVEGTRCWDFYSVTFDLKNN